MAASQANAAAGDREARPTKHTQEIRELLAELKCDPIEVMARIAMEKHSPELRGRMYAELARYIHPKRKAIRAQRDRRGTN